MDAFATKVEGLERQCLGEGVPPPDVLGRVVTLLRRARGETLQLLGEHRQVRVAIEDLNLGPRTVEGFLDDGATFPHFVRRFLKSG